MVGPKKSGIDGYKDWLTDNLISRGVGMVMRTFLIVIFLLAICFFLIFVIVALIFWLGMPLLVILSFLNIFAG